MRKSVTGLASIYLWFVALSAGVWGLQPLTAQAEVRDEAAVFSSAAVRDAEKVIRELRTKFRKDVLVETFAGIPESRREAYARDRELFFSDLVRDRARAAKLDGIYILVMKEPPPHRFRIQVGVGAATRQKAFVASNRDDLVRIFQSAFREDRFDEGLQRGLAYIETTLGDHLSVPATVSSAQRSSTSWQQPLSAPAPGTTSRGSFTSLLFMGIVLLGGLLLVSFLFRLIRGGLSGGMPGAGGSYGGGGFFTGLLGGLGGALAGSWLYDRFLSGNAHASDSMSSNPSELPLTDQGSDFLSSGGDVDFGGSAGGGDYGGDFGGGGDA